MSGAFVSNLQIPHISSSPSLNPSWSTLLRSRVSTGTQIIRSKHQKNGTEPWIIRGNCILRHWWWRRFYLVPNIDLWTCWGSRKLGCKVWFLHESFVFQNPSRCHALAPNFLLEVAPHDSMNYLSTPKSGKNVRVHQVSKKGRTQRWKIKCCRHHFSGSENLLNLGQSLRSQCSDLHLTMYRVARPSTFRKRYLRSSK